MAGIESLLNGRLLAGRYRVAEVIGRGGFAAVYRADDERLHRTVAVKVITAAAADSEALGRMRTRFHREAQAAARLRHPNVVTVYDFGTDPEIDLDFLVMELLQGEDLAARVAREGVPPLDQALRILQEAAEGVAAGHRAGLVHRDIKPGNLFLEGGEAPGRFRVVVLDFGIAQIMAGEQSLTPLTHGRAPLSPSYASPEQLRGEKPLGATSDVYSLGVVGYELLSGERLFGGSGDQSRGGVLPLRERNPYVPDQVARVIERAMAHDPAQRFAGADAMARALAAARGLLDAPAAVASPGPPPLESRVTAAPPARAPQREPAGPAGIARPGRRAVLPLLLGALVLGGLGVWALAGDGEPRSAGVGELARGGAAGDAAGPRAEPASADLQPSPAAVPGGTSSGGESGVDPGSGAPPGGSRAGPPPATAVPAQGAPAAAGGTGDAEALNGAGLRLFAQGDHAAAVDHFRRAVGLAPRNAYYRNNLGWALFRAGQVEAAEREIREALRISPRRDIAHANLGEVRLARGDTAGAIAAYERFLQLNGDPRRERIAERKVALLRGGS